MQAYTTHCIQGSQKSKKTPKDRFSILSDSPQAPGKTCGLTLEWEQLPWKPSTKNNLKLNFLSLFNLYRIQQLHEQASFLGEWKRNIPSHSIWSPFGGHSSRQPWRMAAGEVCCLSGPSREYYQRESHLTPRGQLAYYCINRGAEWPKTCEVLQGLLLKSMMFLGRWGGEGCREEVW